jgi:hypothetical protein
MRNIALLIFFFGITPALAEPVSIGMALLSAGGVAATFGVSYLTGLAITVALSYAARGLAPDMDDFDNAEVGYMTSGTAAAADHQIIYGRQRVGGIIVYKETTPQNTPPQSGDNKELHVIIALAGHEVEEIEAIYANDEELTFQSTLSNTLSAVTAPEKYARQTHFETRRGSGGTTNQVEVEDQPTTIFAAAFNGTADQAASNELDGSSQNKWTPDHRLQGVAYLYVKLVYIADSFPNGEPNITAVVKGKKVYDPRDSSQSATNPNTWTYSDNVALCLRDYLESDYGVNADYDEVDEDTFSVAASVCDETVALADSSAVTEYTTSAGQEKKYALNAAFTTGTEPQKIIDNMVKSMAGALWYSQGKFQCKAGKYTAPVMELNEDDLRGNLRIETRRSRREGFNAVRGTFRGPETNWIKTDYPSIESSSFISTDGGEKVVSGLDLPYTPTNTMAQRIAKVLLYRNREQLVISASFGLRAFQLQVGDNVMITNTRAGWTQKTFEVVGWNFEPDIDNQNMNVNLVLSEIQSTVFDWNADESAFESNNTLLESAFFVPKLSLELSFLTRTINEHVITVLQAKTDVRTNPLVASPSYVESVIAQFRRVSDTAETDDAVGNYINMGRGESGVFEAIDVENGDYEVRVQAVNGFGTRGVYTLGSVNVQAGIESPEDVSEIGANVSGGFTTLEWPPVPNLDLSYYKIRHAAETSGAYYADATDSVIKVARPATSVVVPARSGSYMIRAYDKLGIPSENFTTTVVTDSQLEPFTNTTTVTEHTGGFNGTKTGCSQTGNELRITNYSSQPSTATYTFQNGIDLGATQGVTRVRATGVVKTSRFATSSSWDSVVPAGGGTFDTLSGLWDNLTLNPQEPDTNILFYIRHSNDAISGSPTWSDWKPFKSGDFSGRSFQFKIELKSTADNVTPSVSELSAKVEFN